jgi:hypothetical protein
MHKGSRKPQAYPWICRGFSRILDAWKRVLINNWSDPSNFSNKIWKEVTEHSDPTLRIAAARNPKLPELYLEKLIKDPILSVRLSAILSLLNKLKVIDLLSKDKNPPEKLCVFIIHDSVQEDYK